jgi:Rrf2 family protein
MQHLVRAGILKGVRGPRGGYRLARERRRISVGDIVRIVSALETAEEGRDDVISDLSREIVRPMVDRIQDELMEKLDAITIEDLVRQAETAGVMGDKTQGADFTI